MQRTSDQIYDDIEARHAEARAQSRNKWRSRYGEIALRVIPCIALLVYFTLSKNDYGEIGDLILEVTLGSFLIGGIGLSKRWTLEDKVEQLEKQLKERK